jgi:hypothetical protein
MIRVAPVQGSTDEGEEGEQGAPAPKQRETRASLISSSPKAFGQALC